MKNWKVKIDKLQKESLEIGVIEAIRNWQREKFGNEHLLDIILQAHPTLILNMKERVKND